jgi:AcrR family transcriptional regulator
MTQVETPADKQDVILQAAFRNFASYGFRRTTMDDIAQAAGMSRPALYRHFRNKEDIFRSLTEQHFSDAARDMEAALKAPGQTPAQAIEAALLAKDGVIMDIIFGTPHGRELLDAGISVSGTIAEQGEARLAGILAAYFGQYKLAPGAGTPAELAGTLMAALKGLKLTAADLAGYRAGQSRLAALFAMALLPRG